MASSNGNSNHTTGDATLDENVEIWKVKKLIKRLQAARG